MGEMVEKTELKEPVEPSENRNPLNSNRGKTNPAAHTERQKRPITEKATTAEGDEAASQQTENELKSNRKKNQYSNRTDSRKRRRDKKKEISRRSSRRARRDGKSQPGPCANQTVGEMGKRQDGPRRKYTTWESIGLVEYNPQTTKWECRFEHCQREMIKERLT